ncbi:unnamed protein product [Ixodes hexagonus]
METHLKAVRIWQWNCWGFQRKRAVLQQFIRSHPEKPHVILLQETLSDAVTLPGYKSHVVYDEGKRGICTLVSKGCTSVTHELFETPTRLSTPLLKSFRVVGLNVASSYSTSTAHLRISNRGSHRFLVGQLVKPVVPRSSLPATSTPRTGRGVTRERRARETTCGRRRLITTSRSSRTRRSRPGSATHVRGTRRRI